MRKKHVLLLVIPVIVVGCISMLFIGSKLWNRPLGPTLGLPTQPAGQAAVETSAETSPGSQELPTGSNPSGSLLSQVLGLFKQPSTSDTPACDGPAAMTILLIGSDERADDYLYGLADSIRLVRVDFTTSRVMLLDIPRDLWVEIPGISDHYGITHGKLNQAYFFGNPGMGYYDGPGEGPGLLARTLEQNFGVRVDRYLAIDRTTFVRAIDTIDGIDIHLDSVVDLNQNGDGADPALVLEPGDHHLDGEMTLRLASNRNPTIFQRSRYQDIVLRALQDKVLNPSILPDLPSLIAQFTGSVQTDLSPADINQLVCIGKGLTRENTSIVAFPEDMFTGTSTYDPYRQVNTYTLNADFNQLRVYLADFMSGRWPQK